MKQETAEVLAATAKAVPVVVTSASVAGFTLQQGVYLCTLIWTFLLIVGWLWDRLIKPALDAMERYGDDDQ
jgi:hypothetical protein